MIVTHRRSSEMRLWSLVAVGLILLYAATRMHQLLALPLFIDEASHLTRAQWVWQGKPFYLWETGKALAPYLSAFLDPFHAPPFIGRIVVVLLGMIGITAAYGCTSQLFSRRVGVILMVLWIASPQLFFFERMALVDTTVSAMALVALWFGILVYRKRVESMGSGSSTVGWILPTVLCGVALALTVIAKLTGIVYIILPVVLVLFLPRKQGIGTDSSNATEALNRRRIFVQTAIIYGVFAVLMAAPFAYLLVVKPDVSGQANGLTSFEVTSLPERVVKNIRQTWDAELIYFSPLMLGVLIASAVSLIIASPRRGFLLLALIAAPLGLVFATSEQLWLRYLVPATPFLLILASAGLDQVSVWLARGLDLRLNFVRGMPFVVALLWALSVSVSFFQTAYTKPEDLAIPPSDRREYIFWIPGGFGLKEAAQYLIEHERTPITVVGSAVNCNAARLYIPADSPITLICLDMNWSGGNPHIVKLIQDTVHKDGVVLLLAEDKQPPTVRLDEFAKHEEIAAFPRLHGLYTVRIYRITE